jgi:hypothetical protein
MLSAKCLPIGCAKLCARISFTRPEILPLEAVRGPGRTLPTFANFLRSLSLQRSTARNMVIGIVFSPPVFIGYLPSLIYRVTFKATAVAYLPLIWIAPFHFTESIAGELPSRENY